MLYKTVNADSVKDLDYEVDELLNIGYVLYGSPTHIRHLTGSAIYECHFQTMTYTKPSTDLLTED